MSDDLVKRYDLQQPTHHMGSAELVCDTYGDWVLYRDYEALADRIEELRALRAVDQRMVTKVSKDAVSWKKRADKAEAKLAKALSALERIELSTDNREQGGIAMAALAELKEEDRT